MSTRALREVVRGAVSEVLTETAALRDQPALRDKIADRMFAVSMRAAELLDDERRLTSSRSTPTPPPTEPLAEGLAAGKLHDRTAVSSAADVLRRTRDAIDFPGFVTSLITGVFQAIHTTNIQQLQAFCDLLEAVDASTSDFGANHIGAGRAAEWAAQRFKGFEVDTSSDEPTIALKDGAEMPDEKQLKSILSLSDEEARSVDSMNLQETFLPLVQRKLGRDRQAMLSTMILMGLQRIVVDDGALHASMRLQVDARSVAEQRAGSKLDTRVTTEASAKFGAGAWGASAKLSASVGFVKSDEEMSREDIAVSAGLRSSVDLRFSTSPLDVRRVASGRTLDKLRQQSLVPETEKEIGPGGLLGETPKATTGPSSIFGDKPPSAGPNDAPEPQTKKASPPGGAAKQGAGSAGAVKKSPGPATGGSKGTTVKTTPPASSGGAGGGSRTPNPTTTTTQSGA